MTTAGAVRLALVGSRVPASEAKGLVASEQETAQPGAIGLPRRFYRITALGERLLRAYAAFADALAAGERS